MSILDQAQQRALALNKNISVTAGAGSGKTKILVERYIKIVLQDPFKVRRVLAFTFTNKAAGEMQERVAEEILRRLQNPKDHQEQIKLLQIRDQLNSASISTIHSFCARVLREFPIEAGLSPDFFELDEMRQIILQQEVIQKVFENINQSEDKESQKKWLPLFSILDRATIGEMLGTALSRPFEMEQIMHRFGNFSEDGFVEFLNQEWFKMVQTHLGLIDFSGFVRLINDIFAQDFAAQKNKNDQNIHDILREAENGLRQSSNPLIQYQSMQRLARFMTTQKGTAYKNLATLGSKENWTKQSAALLIQLSRNCEPIAQKIIEFDPGDPAIIPDREWLQVLNSFFDLYRKAAELYNHLKLKQSLVDFEDLQILLLRLLKEHPQIRNELNRRYDHILVDEFQDTNELQWEIIRYLAQVNGQLTKDKIFVVGDPKQSIYGFRDADIRIFNKVKQLFARQFNHQQEEEYEGNVHLNESFRFLPRLNTFINFVFARILREDNRNEFEVGFSPLVSKRLIEETGWIELAVLRNELSSIKSETEYIAQTIQKLISEKHTCFKWKEGIEQEVQIEYGDIAILLRQRTHLLEVEQALRNHDIPFKTAGGIGYWQKQEIFDFYHLLRFISNPKDDFSLVAILRSKMFMIPDDVLFYISLETGNTFWDKLQVELKQNEYRPSEKDKLSYCARIISKWIECRDRLSLSELLNMIMDDIQFRTILAAQLNGEQLVANVDKLIEQIQSYNTLGLGGLNDFLMNLTEFIDREMREGEAPLAFEDRATVKIMTIHAAKGLQFPVVFLPFLNSKIRGQRSNVFIDSELGLAVKRKKEVESNQSPDHLLLRLLKYRQRQKDLAEAKRLFYVACSRASNYLYLSSALDSGQPAKDSFLFWLYDALRSGGVDIFESESMKEPGFEMQIKHHIEVVQEEESDFNRFDMGLRRLRNRFRQKTDKSALPPAYLKQLSDAVGPITFSATRIITYLEDPLEYLNRYHLGFFEQDYETFADDVYKIDHGLLKGKLIHRYFELVPNSKLTPDDLIQNILFEFDIFDANLRGKFIDELTYILTQVAHSKVGKEILQAKKFKNEVVITSQLGDDYFTGTLDRLFLNKDHLWEVVDYKTNRINAYQIEEEAKKYNWQMKSYAFLLSRLFPAQEQYPISLYFLYPDRLFNRVFFIDEILQMEKFLLNTIAEIKKRYPLAENEIQQNSL